MGAVKKKIPLGGHLFNEGDASESLFILQVGTVSIRKHKDGGFIELAKAHSGEVIGEMAFFDRQQRNGGGLDGSRCH